MITDSQFAGYAQMIASFNKPEWILYGEKEWLVEKAIRYGYMIALADITGRKFEVDDFITTTIEKEHEELEKTRKQLTDGDTWF